MKKLAELVFYALGAAAMIFALITDKQADEIYKQNVVNRSGTPPFVNQKAPDFTVRKLGGDVLSSSSELLSSENTILIISSPSCPFTMQLTQQLQKQLKAENKSAANILLVLDTFYSPLLPEEEETWIKEYPVFNVYADNENSTSWGFKVQAYPTQYVLSSDDTVLYRQSGYAGEKSVKLLIEKFLNPVTD